MVAHWRFRSARRAGYVTLEGRLKELIKRGGEQISPQAVDDVLLSHKAVDVAVTFGVPNELYGEEVAAAVVLADGVADSRETRESIVAHARAHLSAFEVPKQLLVTSVDELPKGRTGKYLRSQCAEALGVASVDTGALAALASAAPPVAPHRALAGLRFITICHVFQVHCGLYPLVGWAALQTVTANMTIFFCLAGFGLAASAWRAVERGRETREYIATRLGALHAMRVLHRDVMPQNLLVQPSKGLLKLSGFAIARTFGF